MSSQISMTLNQLGVGQNISCPYLGAVRWCRMMREVWRSYQDSNLQPQRLLTYLAFRGRLERPTCRLEVCCSVLLSYRKLLFFSVSIGNQHPVRIELTSPGWKPGIITTIRWMHPSKSIVAGSQHSVKNFLVPITGLDRSKVKFTSQRGIRTLTERI